ncbi:hypothetical protein [Paraburkholderia sp.]|uniref:hypothetical protein n=1 Tax=Paraburkholderia sp. TaxID=1926495 RepID=UPI003C7A84AE
MATTAAKKLPDVAPDLYTHFVVIRQIELGWTSDFLYGDPFNGDPPKTPPNFPPS